VRNTDPAPPSRPSLMSKMEVDIPQGGMAMPEGLHQSNRIKHLNWLAPKRPPITFQ